LANALSVNLFAEHWPTEIEIQLALLVWRFVIRKRIARVERCIFELNSAFP